MKLNEMNNTSKKTSKIALVTILIFMILIYTMLGRFSNISHTYSNINTIAAFEWLAFFALLLHLVSKGLTKSTAYPYLALLSLNIIFMLISCMIKPVITGQTSPTIIPNPLLLSSAFYIFFLFILTIKTRKNKFISANFSRYIYFLILIASLTLLYAIKSAEWEYQRVLNFHG
jgi:hypothetical protein